MVKSEKMKKMNYVQFNLEKKYIKDCISVPKKLYKKDNTENSKEIKQILNKIKV